jgi:(1->4)-alpha-D-glucan 1-alpha-D-glucosylmutase
VEDPAVFDATHDLILRLLEQGQVTGIRVDHSDGLWDPLGYFQGLQQAVVRRRCQRLLQARQVEAQAYQHLDAETLADLYMAEGRHPFQGSDAWPLYVVVEKILEGHERLPEDWPVHGTTGYDFLNHLNGLFVDGAHADVFQDLYADFVGEHVAFADMLYTTNKLIMRTSLASELESLAEQLERLAEASRYWRDISRPDLTWAIREVVACFPVYRTYTRADHGNVNPADRAVIETAVTQARRRNPHLNAMGFDMLQDVLMLQAPRDEGSTPQAWLQFVQRFQQMTGPVRAKGLEDTAFYRYTPLVSLNEVGGDPDQFGIPVETFHQHNVTRQQRWPCTLLATSTHDTKRSEDVRARLNVLSELPQQWRDHLWRWQRLNEPHKSEVNGQLVPSPQEEYVLYQTLLGAWPLEPYTAEDMGRFRERIQAYMRKALREAKAHTTWTDSRQVYEEAVDRFIVALLDDQVSSAFLDDFRTLQQTIAHYGMWNALAQTVLKITSPGVPDIYRGCELWDLSLVDPDNRRPVDYALRQQLLAELQQRCQGAHAERLELVRELLRTRYDGRIKLYVTWQALTCRRERASVFLEGEYVPLDVEGRKREHLCAFARVHQNDVVLVFAPRLVAGLLPSADHMPLGQPVWNETRVIVPDRLAGTAYRHRFTGEIVYPEQVNGHSVLSLATVFAEFPIAILQRIDG